MAILVTGGAGAIGSWVVRRLLEEGKQPIIFDIKPNTTLIEDVKQSVPIVQGDVLDYGRLVRIIKTEKIKRIIHLAAELSPDVRRVDPNLELRILVDGTANILEAARLMDIERVVYSSSRAVYGKLDPKYGHPTYEPIPEEAASPRSGGRAPIYSVAKFLMERVGLEYVPLGVDFAAVRFGTTYGPGKTVTHASVKPTTMPAHIVVNAMKGETTKILKGGDGLTDFTYYKDIAQGVVRACFAENLQSRIYNIGFGEGCSFKDWAKIVKELFPKASIEVGPGELKEFGLGGGVLDITKAKKELAYEPLYPLRKGIEDFAKEMVRLKFVG